MTNQYTILFKDTELNIHDVVTVERTPEEVVLLDNNKNIVGLFDRELVRGLYKSNVLPSQAEAMIESAIKTAERLDKMEHSIETLAIQLEKVGRPSKAAPSNIKTGVLERENVPFETGTVAKVSKPVIEMRKNPDTKGFEVNITHRDEVAATREEPMGPIVTATLRYKDILADGLYDTQTKEVIIPKGTLIAKKDTTSVRKSKQHTGAKQKRSQVLHKYSEPHDKSYKKLTEDVSFTSLSQASIALTGSILNTKSCWTFKN